MLPSTQEKGTNASHANKGLSNAQKIKIAVCVICSVVILTVIVVPLAVIYGRPKAPKDNFESTRTKKSPDGVPDGNQDSIHQNTSGLSSNQSIPSGQINRLTPNQGLTHQNTSGISSNQSIPSGQTSLTPNYGSIHPNPADFNSNQDNPSGKNNNLTPNQGSTHQNTSGLNSNQSIPSEQINGFNSNQSIPSGQTSSLTSSQHDSSEQIDEIDVSIEGTTDDIDSENLEEQEDQQENLFDEDMLAYLLNNILANDEFHQEVTNEVQENHEEEDGEEVEEEEEGENNEEEEEVNENATENNHINTNSSDPAISQSPSDILAILPSVFPSDIPTISPSNPPSLFPSIAPSNIPTIFPSEQPSTETLNKSDFEEFIKNNENSTDSHFKRVKKIWESYLKVVESRDWDKDGYYSVLGVDKNASYEDIKKAYRENVIIIHPDKVKHHLTPSSLPVRWPATLMSNELKEDIIMKLDPDFKVLSAAWETLGDNTKRAQYDKDEPNMDDLINRFRAYFEARFGFF